MSAWDSFTAEQLEYVLQFNHPEKKLVPLPGVNDRLIADLFSIDLARLRRIRRKFRDNARRAAKELLADRAFASAVGALPFRESQTVVALGDSITDDWQSWFEILRYLTALRRPGAGIRFVNAAVSGDPTTDMISRFLGIVAVKPDWIICMAGTNDCRRHGLRPTKILVTLEETKRNLAMLRNFAATQTSARWVWMTPTPVIEEKIPAHWFLGPMQIAWCNDDLRALAEVVRTMPDPSVDLWAAYGEPPRPDWLLPDGLHPSLDGQVAIVKALVKGFPKS